MYVQTFILNASIYCTGIIFYALHTSRRLKKVAHTHTHTCTHLLFERQNNDKPCGLANMLIVYHAKLQHIRWPIHLAAHACSLVYINIDFEGINGIWEIHIAVKLQNKWGKSTNYHHYYPIAVHENIVPEKRILNIMNTLMMIHIRTHWWLQFFDRNL